MNRTLLESTISMLFHARMPLRFWADAGNTAAYVRSRCPAIALKGCTPYEIWFKGKPSISNLTVAPMFTFPKRRQEKKIGGKIYKVYFNRICRSTGGIPDV